MNPQLGVAIMMNNHLLAAVCIGAWSWWALRKRIKAIEASRAAE